MSSAGKSRASLRRFREPRVAPPVLRSMSRRVSMPLWPAWALAGLAAACAYPAVTTTAPAEAAETANERYEARGQEPGWRLVIHDGRMDYSGRYGEKKISVPRPEPRPSFNGLRYVTPRLTVDVTYVRCNDAMSGRGYAHQVTVAVGDETVRGCGGERRPDWDK
jgi:uncharacterized membrane protein